MSPTELKGKIRTLLQGQGSDLVHRYMASTFLAFVKLADFSGETDNLPDDDEPEKEDELEPRSGGEGGLSIAGLSYAIHLQLPESRDPMVYDALFKSLKAHLLG